MKKIALVVFLFAAFAVAADTPKLSDSQKLSIRNAQVELQQLQLQMDNLKQQYTECVQKQQQMQVKLQDAVKSAYASVKVSQEDYTLDGNLDLVPIPKLDKPAPAAKPERK